jgi:hypothetical protein
MVGKRTEGESGNKSTQTDQLDHPPQVEAGAEVAEALARVQEAVIDVKEGGLPQALEAAIEAIDAAVSEVPDEPEPLQTPWRALSRRWRGARSPICCPCSSRLRRLSNPTPDRPASQRELAAHRRHRARGQCEGPGIQVVIQAVRRGSGGLPWRDRKFQSAVCRSKERLACGNRGQIDSGSLRAERSRSRCREAVPRPHSGDRVVGPLGIFNQSSSKKNSSSHVCGAAGCHKHHAAQIARNP